MLNSGVIVIAANVKYSKCIGHWSSILHPPNSAATAWYCILIPDTRDSPKSPGSPHHESLGTQHIAVASANGIAARLSSF
jgi:hypothetical protein